MVVRLGLTIIEDNKLLVAKRKVFQKEDGSCRVRTNAELEELVAQPNIIGETKAHKLHWLGHLKRMEDDWNVKRAYLGRRPFGRRRYH